MGNCFVDVAVTISGIDIKTTYTGVLDLNGNAFVVNGSGTSYFRGGTLSDTPGTSSLALNSTGIIRFLGTTMNASVTGSASSIVFSGGVFNGVVDVEANSGGTSDGSGGCTFNNDFSIIDLCN